MFRVENLFENDKDKIILLKGLVMMDKLNISGCGGSTTQVPRLFWPLYRAGLIDSELFDWILHNKKNSYSPFGHWHPWWVINHSQYLKYKKQFFPLSMSQVLIW